MIDTHKALRKSYYDALQGNLTVQETGLYPVNVYDELAFGRDQVNEKYYVLLSTQTATDSSTLDRYGTEATILLDIVHRTGSMVTKDVVDEIGQQILSIVLPVNGTNGLIPQPFLSIMLVKKESDQYFPVQTTSTGLVLRRLIRFSQFIHET